MARRHERWGLLEGSRGLAVFIILKTMLSMSFKDLVSFLLAIQATRFPAFTWAGLAPAEHASLSWTHRDTCHFSVRGVKPMKVPRPVGRS